MRSTPLAGDRTCSQTAGGEEREEGKEQEEAATRTETDRLKQGKTAFFFRHDCVGTQQKTQQTKEEEVVMEEEGEEEDSG